MRTPGTTVVLLGILLAVPATGLTALIATHATKGVVKSVDSTSLVITRFATTGGDMGFVLNQATKREGDVVVGSIVQVRYRREKQGQVATAIRVEEPQRPPTDATRAPRY